MDVRGCLLDQAGDPVAANRKREEGVQADYSVFKSKLNSQVSDNKSMSLEPVSDL